MIPYHEVSFNNIMDIHMELPLGTIHGKNTDVPQVIKSVVRLDVLPTKGHIADMLWKGMGVYSLLRFSPIQ